MWSSYPLIFNYTYIHRLSNSLFKDTYGDMDTSDWPKRLEDKAESLRGEGCRAAYKKTKSGQSVFVLITPLMQRVLSEVKQAE